MKAILGGFVALGLSVAASNVMAAPLDGQFVLMGSSAQGTFNGSAFVEVNPFDIYGFQVTNNSGVNIFTFQNLVFQGNLLQNGGLAVKLGTALALDPFDNFIAGTQLTPDSFFTDNNIAPTTVGGSTDSTSQLSAVAVGTLGQAWIANGATETIAVLCVPAGQLPEFISGGGTTGTTLTPITVVPEPASMALIALGGLALLRRRA